MAIIGRIRKHSAIAVTVIALAIAAFIIGDVFNNQRSNAQMRNAGRVDGEDISYTELEAKVLEQENMYRNQAQKDQISNEELFMLRDNAWAQIVQGRVLNREYNALGITVCQAEMNDMFVGEFIHPYLRQIPAFTDQTTGEYNRAFVSQYNNNFENLPDDQKAQWVDLQKYTKEDRLSTKYNGLIAQGFYTPTAIANIIGKLNSKTVNTRYVVANYSTIPDAEVTIGDADYKKYYDSHKEEFKEAEASRDIEYVVFQINPTSEDLVKIQNNVYSIYEEFKTIEDNEMQVFVNSESDARYDAAFRGKGFFEEPIDSIVNNSPAGTFIEPMMTGNQWKMGKVIKVENRPDSIRLSTIFILNNRMQGISRTNEEAKVLADSLLNILKSAPFLFSQFVQANSDDPQRTENMGDMGWIPDGFYSDEMLSTNTMGVFISERQDGSGYELCQIAEKTEYKRKAQVALITEDIEASDNTTKDIYARASKFAADSRTLTELRDNAQKEGLMIRSADRTAEMSNRLPGLESAREIVRWAFNGDTKAGSVAEEVFNVDGAYIVASLKDIREKGYATLAQVKPLIEQQVRTEKRAEIMMEKVKKTLQGTQDINTIAMQLNTIVDTIEGVGFGDYYFGRNGAEMSVLGNLPQAKANTLMSPIKGYNGVYVLYVDAVEDRPADPMGPMQQMEMMNQQKARMAMQVLIENTKIKDTRGLFY